MKTITFDCYGTLLNIDSLAETVARLGQERGLAPEKAAAAYELNETRLMYAEPFRPLPDLVREALERCDTMLGTDFFHLGCERILTAYREFPAYPEVVPTLRELKRRGYRLIILSNSCHAVMEHNLRTLGGVIDEVLLAEDVRAYKPSQAVFDGADTRFSLDRAEHVHVAQGYFEDIVPGKTRGWRRIWVNRQGEAANPKWAPEREVRTLDQVLDLLP